MTNEEVIKNYKSLFIEYTNAFKLGLSYVLYYSDEETRYQPTVDFNDISSLGYNDGYKYGEYCERTGQAMSISEENLTAIIDKYFTQTLKKYGTQQENHILEKGISK